MDKKKNMIGIEEADQSLSPEILVIRKLSK